MVRHDDGPEFAMEQVGRRGIGREARERTSAVRDCPMDRIGLKPGLAVRAATERYRDRLIDRECLRRDLIRLGFTSDEAARHADLVDATDLW